MSPRQAWRAIQAGMPEDVIISSDIGNNCAIGNGKDLSSKSFEKGRKYLAPGISYLVPCGYGFPIQFLEQNWLSKYSCSIGFAGDGAFGIEHE